MAEEKELNPKKFYDDRVGDRGDYENRAQKYASLTLPYLFRRDGSDKGTPMDDAIAQSYCGRLVNVLKSKMGMALLPPSTSSFRLVPDSEAFEEILQGDDGTMNEIYEQLSQQTNRINTEIERQSIRESLFLLVANLIVVGSVIVEKKDKKGIVLHPLRSFVVELDSQGEALAMCFVEKMTRLPEGVTVKEEKDEYELYTLIYKSDEVEDQWSVTQTIEDEAVGEEQTFKTVDLPYQYLGWNWMPGDSLHRPYVEDYYPDMDQLNKLSTVLTEGAIIASKSILFVDQRGGRTRTKDVAESANGDVLDGNGEDVTAFQLQKNFDFQVPMEREANLKRELAAAFLMNESATRDAERVTASEIRYMAQELEESSLSGIYSMMAVKWSKWIVAMVMKELKVEFDAVDVNIITGLDALGRSQEAQKLDQFVTRAVNLEQVQRINMNGLLQRYAALEGLDVTGLLKDETTVEQETQASQQQAVEQEASAAAAQSAGQAGGAAMVEQQMQGA